MASKQVQLTSLDDSNLDSELDCSVLVELSDDEKMLKTKITSNSKSNENQQQVSTSGSAPDHTQVMANRELLKQLTKLDQRLDVLDKDHARKTEQYSKDKSSST